MRTNITLFVVAVLCAVLCAHVAAPVVFAQQQPGDGGTDVFGGSGGGIKNPLQGSSSITDVLKRVINWMLGLVGFLALIALIIGGLRMIMDFGNEEQVKKAKKTIMWAVIGLMVVILSYAIINIITSDILGAGGGPSAQEKYENDPPSL
jgi:preprotein translocase subunit SecG